MGHYTDFWASNHPMLPPRGMFPAQDAPNLTAKYRLPAVWLALFDADDLQLFSDLHERDLCLECVDADDPLASSDFDVSTHLASPREAALQRLERRSDWLLRRFPTLQPLWLEQFRGWIGAMPEAYVHVSTDDVACIFFSAAEWGRELPLILRMFDEPFVAPASPVAAPPGALDRSLAHGRRDGAAAIVEPSTLTGWDRYRRNFLDPGLAGSPAAQDYLGRSNGSMSVPWDCGN